MVMFVICVVVMVVVRYLGDHTARDAWTRPASLREQKMLQCGTLSPGAHVIKNNRLLCFLFLWIERCDPLIILLFLLTGFNIVEG